MAFTAAYDSGTCPECDGPIKAGQLIRQHQDGGCTRCYEHVVCPEVVAESERLPQVCPSCWVAHAGTDCY